ncbi:MAG: hypothetical protein GF418_11040 [Chitinivibrionales bacterium]|nr:hypothetical protein [Chitinivibrionales bacterium]MBD3396150.1 hypothetical protein [Chitinivibrionales bacterium]
MKKSWIFVFVCSLGLLTPAATQVVTFNSPSPWMSLRSTEVAVKTLLDTAKLENKPVRFVLYKVVNGRKASLGSQTARATQYSHDFVLGKVASGALGGTDYLRIEWSVSGKDEAGTLEPFGVLIVDSGKVDTVAVGTHVEELSMASAGKMLTSDDFITVGKHKFGVLWTRETLGIVIKKGPREPLTFSFDGKNGKSAFLSYPDRFVSFFPEGDSIRAYHHARAVSDTGILYTEKEWLNKITVSAGGDLVLVSVPWYDTGIIPFDGRIVGFAAFAEDQASEPAGAKRRIPGTWGDLVLVGGPKEPSEEIN